MNQLLKILEQNETIKAFVNGKRHFVAPNISAQALLLTSSFVQTKKDYFVVCNSLYQAQRLHDVIITLLDDSDDCLLFPSDESFRVEALASSPELLMQRVYVMNKLIQHDRPRIIIAHTASLVRHVPTMELFKKSSIHLQVGQSVQAEGIIDVLVNNGYQKVSKIDSPLQFATRGSILDIYSINYENPLRIEFFGDEIDSIRYFDVVSQRTIQTLKDVTILPSSDLLVDLSLFHSKLKVLHKIAQNLTHESLKHRVEAELEEIENNLHSPLLYKYYSLFVNHTASILDYTSESDVVLIDYSSIEQSFKLLQQETFEYIEEFYIDQENVFHLNLHHSLTAVLEKAKKQIIINEFATIKNEFTFQVKEVNKIYGSQERFMSLVDEYRKQGTKIVFCLDNGQQGETVTSWMKEEGSFLDIVDSNTPITEAISCMYFSLLQGFELADHQIVYISAKELFGTANYKKNFNTYKYKNSVAITSYDNLNIGDYVVHVNHGIGQFVGLKTLEVEGVHRDYLHIAYQGNDILYVPLEQFQLVRKFVSKEGAVPKLSKLGGKEWSKTKDKIKSRVKDIAERLIHLYSTRASKKGFAFSPDQEYQVLFENTFPYELTPDQKRSIAEIKEDMEKPEPMDRLLCGDVGFGKTEVAFVAAFKAVLDRKQVAILCPTTLLARQHYNKALERFQNFPVKVALVSRFVSPKEIEEILKQLYKGEIDILIGTHRILSKDIHFHDLGLLVVDEEQRFGVEHKERIKEMKETIDVLTLSATPIPRTLQMALIGIRNLSQIETAPLNRMPIQTYVMESNQKVIKEIIERELGRNGQVFYLYNKTSDISFKAANIQRLVPNARVIYAHGKMDKEQIEEAMIAFYEHEVDVMVCTTIIENGIDVPNANTIIIEDADKYGLSQLYQIKGRVGRSDRLAYAYLLYRANYALKEVALKRLHAIKEFTELGSGYRIAMRDLSIRGAGDILGAEQAGFIDTVGLDMYIRLLKEAIEEEKTGVVKPEVVSKAIIQRVDGYIPEQFSSDDLDKIELYQKIDACETVKALHELTSFLVDAYGKLPKNVVLLLKKRELEILTTNYPITNFIDHETFVTFEYDSHIAHIDGIGYALFSLTVHPYQNVRLTYKNKVIQVRMDKNKETWLAVLVDFIYESLRVIQKEKKKLGILDDEKDEV